MDVRCSLQLVRRMMISTSCGRSRCCWFMLSHHQQSYNTSILKFTSIRWMLRWLGCFHHLVFAKVGHQEKVTWLSMTE